MEKPTRLQRLAEAQAEALRTTATGAGGKKGTLAEQYIQVLIAQELRQNSKWIISNGEAMPVIELRETHLKASKRKRPKACIMVTHPG